MSLNDDNLIWIDLEMTGLDPEVERIIEIATVVTDPHLNVLGEGPVIAIHQSNELLDNMGEWCTKQHTSSGLVDRIKESTVTEAHAESQTIEFLKQYVPPGKSPMCGNTICQDRRFLYRYMPKLVHFFHYRNLDVSSIKELAQRWAPNVLNGVSKEMRHLALSDVHDSINELRHYREHFFNLPEDDSV